MTALLQEDGDVVMKQSQDEETIEIATDWSKGEEAFEAKKPHEATGFIGHGATKRAIYVRHFSNTIVVQLIVEQQQLTS